MCHFPFSVFCIFMFFPSLVTSISSSFSPLPFEFPLSAQSFLFLSLLAVLMLPLPLFFLSLSLPHPQAGSSLGLVPMHGTTAASFRSHPGPPGPGTEVTAPEHHRVRNPELWCPAVRAHWSWRMREHWDCGRSASQSWKTQHWGRLCCVSIPRSWIAASFPNTSSLSSYNMPGTF